MAPLPPTVRRTYGGIKRPVLAVVSGRPGSGKSTLARELAAGLPCPLVSRDEVYEGIFHSLGQDAKPATKDWVSQLTFDTFFRTIEILASSGVTLVAEAAFQDKRWRIGLEPLLHLVDLRIVHCCVPAELAAQRVTRRRLRQPNAPHERRARAAGDLGEQPRAPGPFERVSLPAPTLHVDTADEYDPPLDDIIAFILAR